MLLLNELSRLEGMSTKELSIDELSMLRVELESSMAIKELEGRRRPKRGGVMYSFVSLLLLAMWKEVRGQTHKGVLNSLGNHDLICLDLKRKPSVGTLCHFVTRVLPKHCEDIGDELTEAVLKSIDSRVYTIDSTPLEAGRYNFQANQIQSSLRDQDGQIAHPDGIQIPDQADPYRRIGRRFSHGQTSSGASRDAVRGQESG